MSEFDEPRTAGEFCVAAHARMEAAEFIEDLLERIGSLQIELKAVRRQVKDPEPSPTDSKLLKRLTLQKISANKVLQLVTMAEKRVQSPMAKEALRTALEELENMVAGYPE